MGFLGNLNPAHLPNPAKQIKYPNKIAVGARTQASGKGS